MRDRTDVLAKAVDERLAYIGWGYRHLAAATQPHDPRGTGLSESGIAKIVQGSLTKGPQRRTARLLELGLQWPRGTVRDALRGILPDPAMPFRYDPDELI